MRRAVERRGDYAGDYRVVLPDGIQHWVAARGRVHPDADGKPARMVGAAIDITSRKQSEAALREGEERFRRVAETAGEFIWKVDAEGLYTYASPSVEKAWATPRPSWWGKCISTICLSRLSVKNGRPPPSRHLPPGKRLRDAPNPSVSKSGKLVHLEKPAAPRVLDPAGNSSATSAPTPMSPHANGQVGDCATAQLTGSHCPRLHDGQLASSLVHELTNRRRHPAQRRGRASCSCKRLRLDLDELRAILADIRGDDQRAGAVIDRMRALLKRREVDCSRLDLDVLAGEVVTLAGRMPNCARWGSGCRRTRPCRPFTPTGCNCSRCC